MKKNNWKNIFSSKRMSYNKSSLEYIKSTKKHNISFFEKSYSLTKIIYPLLERKIYVNIINVFKKQIFSFAKQNKNVSMLDFGSGNGAFLLYFINKFNFKKNYSIELSKKLISIQKKILKDTKFIYVKDNIKTSFFKKIKNNSVDITISASVFQYFRSDFYAKNIIKNFIRVSKKIIILYDIKNFENKKKYLNNLRLRQKLTKEEFFQKYKYTPLKFYKKKFFKQNFKKNKKIKKIIFRKMPPKSLDGRFGYIVIYKLK